MALEHLPRRALDDDLTLISTAGLRSWLMGLGGLDALSPNEALELRTPCVDTLAVRFPIDLIWLRKDGTVRRVDRHVAPRRVRVCVGSARVVECAAGRADAFIAALTGGPGPSEAPEHAGSPEPAADAPDHSDTSVPPPSGGPTA